MLASQSQAGQIRLATESPEPLPIDEVLIDGPREEGVQVGAAEGPAKKIHG